MMMMMMMMMIGFSFERALYARFYLFPSAKFHEIWTKHVNRCRGVSIFTVGINSKSFPWPVHSVQETCPKFSVTSDASWRNLRLS